MLRRQGGCARFKYINPDDFSGSVLVGSIAAGAAEGKAHGADWRINEPQHGYLTPAKLLAMTAIDLLYEDATL